MADWFTTYLASLQGGMVRSLAVDLRAGGLASAGLAFGLGALHALTPGHGKAALAAYFLGREARIGKGLRVALAAALLHVVSGFAAFLVLRLIVGQAPSMFGRGSPTFTGLGYALIIVAGLVMLVQSVRPAMDHAHDHGAHTLTAGIGLLPCPLTISVLGFAWVQASAAMVGLVLVALALGISLTIGSVALIAILARRTLGAALGTWLPGLERGARVIQGLAGGTIVVIGLAMLASLRF